MAKKEIKAKVKLQSPAGGANPAPPVGPALSQHGVNIGEFVKRFNDETKARIGEVVPTIVNVFEDRTYQLIYKTEPAANLILKALGKEKGSGTPNTVKIGTLTKAQVKEIAEKKMVDLNANDLDAAMKIIAGSARSMGVEVK